MRKEAERDERQEAEPPHGIDGIDGSDEAHQSLSHAKEDGRAKNHGEEGQEGTRSDPA